MTAQVAGGLARNEIGRVTLALQRPLGAPGPAKTETRYCSAAPRKRSMHWSAPASPTRSCRTSVAIVGNPSLPEARAWFGTLAELARLARADLRGPATILLGEALRERLATARFGGAPRVLAVSERG